MPSHFIPAAKPLAQYLSRGREIDEAMRLVLTTGQYILGREVEAFEKEWSAYVGVRFAVGVGSGTDALTLALRACGIGPGHEVITTPHTAVATIAAIELAGATPVLADIEPNTCLLDPAAAARHITARTRAIIPVHLFGQPADMIPILEIARARGIRVIEDCAQAHGAIYRGKRVGSWGDVGCFSFYPTKNLGAIGDGGAIVTNDEQTALLAAALRQYGWRQRYVSEVAGANSRLDELQAAILRVKLPYLDQDNACRVDIAARYSRALGSHVTVPVVGADRTSCYHLYVVSSAEREQLRTFLEQKGIGTAIHYPVPVHLQPAYRGRLGDTGSFPIAEQAATQILSLPMYPELTLAECDCIIEAVQQFCHARTTHV
ncbi:MAG: DegT/DnrJ/EryC1/StrS family aminotransferase [Acidobacteriia bacterium]|nr:DegT/DnrJ/EryC1/StrS family aminotransferase [Terriglobia bacterium]